MKGTAHEPEEVWEKSGQKLFRKQQKEDKVLQRSCLKLLDHSATPQPQSLPIIRHPDMVLDRGCKINRVLLVGPYRHR